jgi:hypothetical protein
MTLITRGGVFAMYKSKENVMVVQILKLRGKSTRTGSVLPGFPPRETSRCLARKAAKAPMVTLAEGRWHSRR